MRPDLPYDLHPECSPWNYLPHKVDEYEARLRNGDTPPPITLCNGLLLDGAHRVEAWLRVYGDTSAMAIEELPSGEDPARFVHEKHLGTRELSLSEKREYIKRRSEITGMSIEDCILAFRPGIRPLLRAGLVPKAPRIHRQPGASPEVDTLVRVVIPDSHGEHIDIPARDAFLADLKDLDVHEIVMLGDHLDCGGTMSTHQKSYSNEKTESYTDDCNAANVFLDHIQRVAPKARVHYLEGNHEQHVERWAVREFESKKDSDKILERIGPASMLSLKRRGITYYQRSEMYMGLSIPGCIKLGKCYFVHGVSHSKNADQAHLQRFGDNVVFGHVHRVQSMNTRTVTSEGHGAWCPGTLAKLQPLYAHTAPTEWSHGYGVQFVAKSGEFIHINVPIHKGKSLLRLTGLFDRLAVKYTPGLRAS